MPTDWGTYQGKARKPCPGDPLALTGQPIGMYHCEFCGEMVVAAMEHVPPDADYEESYGMDWPPGYEESP